MIDQRLKLDKLFGRLGEIDAAVLGEINHIFDSDAIFALKVYSGLNGNNVAYAQVILVYGANSGCFVDIHTNTVSKTVTEAFTIAGFFAAVRGK